MSKGLLDLPSTFRSHLGDAGIGLVGKRGVTDARCERTVLPLVLAHSAGPYVHKSRSASSSHLLRYHNGNAAVAAAVLAFTRLSSVAVSPGPNNSDLQVLGRRWQSRCTSELPTERDFLSIEASTSSDGAGIEGEESSEPFFQDIQIDLNLPRRKMLVEFTCNVCDARTQRLINPEAYRRGTIFVQCAGCEAYHQLVDNLNLIQEFDFRKDNGNGSTGK